MADHDEAIVVGIGELLWDVFEDGRRPGGAPANVAFHAGQLGLTGIVCSRVGADEPGSALLHHLEQHGMDTRYVQRDAEHPTGTVTVSTERPDHPAYTIHQDAAWDFLTFDDALAHVCGRAAAICFGTLAQRRPDSARTIDRFLETADGALRIYDVNLRPPWYTQETIDASLRRADVVKLNIDEMRELAAMFGLSDDAPREFADALIRDYEVRRVCITRGAGGCILLTADETVDVPARPVTVVDAVGAGDAFTAALTNGLLRDWPMRLIATFANEVGALVAARSGAMPQLRRELAALQFKLVQSSQERAESGPG
ncbi:MAG: carbohydrate kinase [Phycisphaerae bacterium]